LPVSEWPRQDLDLAKLAFARAESRFDEQGPGAHLAETTVATLHHSYRRWLGWIKAFDPAALSLHPADRVTRTRVKAYSEHLATSGGSVFVATRVAHLYAMSRYMTPERDWEWLKVIKRRLEALARPKSRRAMPFTSAILVDLGLAMMDEAEGDPGTPDDASNRSPSVDRCLLYRDGLLIALAALVAPRRRTAARLVLGENVLYQGGQWRLAIAGDDTKTGARVDGVLPPWLGERLTRYVDYYRTRLAGSKVSNYLWISHKLGPLTPVGMCAAFQTRIRRRTGIKISFHDLRRIAATTIAIADPENVAAASDLLTHEKQEMTQRYLLQGRQTAAIRVIGDLIARRRKSGQRL
jgi:integrase